MNNLITKKTVSDSHISIKDRTLRQNTWVSHDFESDVDLSKITSSLSHMKCTESFQWEKFKGRVDKLKEEDQKIRVACGPVFKPNSEFLRYKVEKRVPVPTHFFGIIIKNGTVESYVLPNRKLKNERSLKDFKKTVEKVQSVSGVVFGDATTSIDQTPDPQACVILAKKDFTILSNPRTRQPYCTIHKISQNSLKGNTRRATFKKENDPRLVNVSVDNNDYKKTGMHKGHLVPAENCKASSTKMKDSCTLSNAAPQHPNLNKSRWRRLETYTRKVVKELPDADDEATVISGPLFRPTVRRGKTHFVKQPLMGDSEIPLASHFFKVIHTPSETKALLLRHNNNKFKGKTEDLVKEAEVSMARLKKLSGIDFDALLRDA